MKSVAIDCAINVAIYVARNSISGNINIAPAITNVVTGSITDTTFTISADIAPNELETTVVLHYGLTPSMTEVPIAFPESPIAGETETQAVSLTLTGLLPYKRYFFRIVATSSVGSTYVNGNVITLEPVELTDGNWVAQYDAEYEKNVPLGTNNAYVAELRDKQFDCALGQELNPQPLFDASTGWTLAAGIAIAGGNLEFTNVANNTNAYFIVNPTTERVSGPYRLEMPGISGRVGTISVVSNSSAYSAGATFTIPDGDFAKDVCMVSNGVFYLRALGGGSYGIFPALSFKRILGNHAWGSTANSFPLKNTNKLEFDGSNDRLTTQSLTAIGTVYAFVRRVGTDAELVMRNDLTGWGNFTSPVLYIGGNDTTTYYTIHLRRLWIRSVTDDAGIISKLNEWFSRDSYNVPPLGEGYLATGIWDDTAVAKDTAIPVTI